MVLTKAQAKSLDILEVARSLGMEMKRKSHREYYWAEHDSFKIDTVKNTWHWYSQNVFGDTINLVQQMQNVSYKDAMVFLETGSFPEAKPVEEERKPFNYTLAPYEQPFVEARAYLKEIRGLSDDTIDFFLEKGVLAQAKRKDKEGVIEDVLVFKYLDRNQQLVGASLQGLVPDQERHPGKGYLKQIMYQSESISGLNVSIGSPKRLIVAEAPIDLMSYYELHKGELNDVRLVAMEGLKEGVLSHYVLEILQERGDIPMDERDYTKSSELTRTSRFLSVAAETSTLFQDHKYDDLITLAVDRDKAGTDFITKLREKKIPVVDARPPQREGQEKTDWNDALRIQNQQSLVDLSAVSVENEKSFNNPLELVWELHSKWEDELAEKIREDLGINYELQAWQFEKEMSRFITTDLDKLFAKRTRLERDAYFADSTTSIRKEIDRLDAQILEYIEKAPEQSQEKTDWNDTLRTQNQQSLVDLSAVSVENEKSFNNPLELVWELHSKWEDELAKKIREDLGINYELQAWQFEKEMSRFITTDLDKLFAKRTRLERDAYFADSTTSIRKEIDRLDAQILEYIEKAPKQSQEKIDWNEILKQEKQLERDAPDNSRLAQARRKLERLRGEQDEAISRAYSHQALTNGQPMNDKRGGANFMRKQEQIEGQVFSKMDEIRQQEERVERLEHQQHLKEMGLNRQGSGLEMSVQNIPRIREELEKAKRGESFFTKATLKRYQKELTRLEAISEQMGKTSIQPAAQALIDEGLVNQWKKQPNTYFVKGLRRVALELTEEGEFQLSSQTKYHPKTDEERLKVDELLAKQRQENIQLGSVESEEKEKSLESIQETGNNSEQNKKAETKLGDFPEESQGAAPLPEANISQPLNDLSPSQTRSQPLLYFSINEDRKSIHKDNYHPISDKDLLKLNRYALHLQNAAQWYLENVADSQVTYFYQDGVDTNSLAISYNKESFMHLTGIYPYREGQTAEQTLLDFATGNGQFDNILIANRGAAFDKLKVLPELPAIVDAESFYFGDLSDVEKFHSLNLDKAIRSNDQDVLLAFRTVDGTVLPASLMRLRKSLNLLLDQTNQEKIILGVFRERDGHIEQLSINEEYVKDKGAEMLSVLNNKQYEEVSKEIEQSTPENTLNSLLLDSATFTQVLDTVYNLGVPGDISKTPEEFHQAWNQYLDYAKQHNDNFDQIVAAAGADHLLDTNSDFYKEWQQDHIYKENYHVRLQWAEERPDGPKLPFKETELISYQDFARELYKANQDFYPIHQEGMKQVTAGNTEGYIPPTKVQFSIYAPDGELIQDSIRYNIGEEINPIAHKERLGTREMRENPELMKIDGAIFTQYHLERLASELDISQFSYALEDTPYADQLLSQVPFGVLENSPIGFSDSSHDSRLGFISFDGMDSVEVENLSAWFEKLGVKDSPMEQVALVEKWQKEIKDLSEKVEQTIENIRDEFEKTQEEEIKLEEQVHNKQELKRDADADGVSDDEELLQGTNPYDFRSKPGSKPDVEEGLQAEEVVLAAGSLAVADLTQNTDIGLYIRFNWSENKAIRDRFEEDELVPYEEFIEILYFENERLRPEGNGYYKTSFDIENEKGESYTFGIRYDIGSELYPLSEMMDERFSEEYIEYASKLDKKAIEKVQSELDETKNNRKEIIDADEELKAEEVVLATSSLAVADFIQNKDMAGLSRHLKEGIKEFLDSDKYKDYLTKMSQLNNYSNRNLRLILAQNPEARQVASFKQWKENFGRYVKKGEKALRIFKPMTKIKKDENNQPILDKNGKPETVTFFGLVPVFDVSQTEGKEMPKAAEVKEQLTDLDYANLYRALMAIAKENDVSVRFEEMENNTHGYYSVPENQIVLRSNEMNKAQIIKTFLHEMAHAELHHADNPQKENLTRSTAELQAESVAYVVSSYYGIDTSEYSFNYLSGWSADKETLADLEAQLDIVQQEAKSLMVRMDQALEQLRLSQEKQTKRSFEQKLEKFKDQNKQAVEEHKQELKADAQSKKERGFSK